MKRLNVFPKYEIDFVGPPWQFGVRVRGHEEPT